MQQTTQKRIALIAGIVVFAVGALFLIFHSNTTDSKKAANENGPTQVYHDPVSGQDITTQTGKAPESMVSSPTVPTFAGFDKLMDMGMSLTQVQGLYAAFEQYQPLASNKVEISLDVKNIQSLSPVDSDPLYRWSFVSDIVANRKTTYPIQIYYWGLNSVELTMTLPDKTAAPFDSGPMNVSDTPDID
jgi:hypothetical protein